MNHSSDHYFTASPGSQATPKDIQVSLAGQDFTLQTSGGVFSPDHVDRGTEILLKKAPAPEAGPILDLGCGWGPIALSCALQLPDEEVWAVDVNERARDLARANAERLGLTNVHVRAPEEVPADLRFAEIWSNPPIRVGKTILHGILEQWIPRLMHGGFAYLVVAKHLGADSLQRWIGERFENIEVQRYARDKGFHILQVERVSP